MENEIIRRGRSGSRASSTSSSLEVRCACQYYKSDSLLPERSALAATRPASKYQPLKMIQTPPPIRKSTSHIHRYGDHEYEPIGQPALRVAVSQHSVSVRMVAPVVKITDTDVVPVADSDDSIDDRYRFRQRALILDGDVILPLDGRIEDNAMDGRNLGDQTVDNSIDELETPQEYQDRLEERFKTAATPGGESRTDAEINTSQVDSSGIEELPLRRGARNLQQRLKTQAGKIRSRFRGIQKPTFTMPRAREKATKATVTTSAAAAKPPPSPHQKASRMERFRMALPERPKFSLPDKSKFHIDKSKFHLPERSKFNLPDKSKFQIKKPNIQFPSLPKSLKRSASMRGSREPSQASEEAGSTASGSARRNVFDFSTFPRAKKLFERKQKSKPEVEVEVEYVTSSPKESRAQSTESSTFPRAKKSLSARWAQRFNETTSKFFHDDTEISSAERLKPWRHPSLEEPRLSLKPQTSMEQEEEIEEEKLPWENTERRTYDAEDEAAPDDDEEKDISYAGKPLKDIDLKPSYEKEPVKDPRIDDEQLMNRIGTDERKKKVTLVEDDDGSIADPEADDVNQTYHPKELGSFPPVDPRQFREGKRATSELSEDEESMRSDREIQQSSGSSCERRRRGVIEEIDSDEFFLREKGISQENMRFHLISEIREALRPRVVDETPPVRPQRIRSMRKRKEESLESHETTPPPERPKRERSLRRSQESFSAPGTFERAGSVSSSRHRIVYQTETPSIQRDMRELSSEPLDDIVVVKPERRKSRTSLRSQSQSRLPTEEENILSAPMHENIVFQRQEFVQSSSVPPVPTRRKRLRRDQSSSLSIRTTDSTMYNGYNDSGSLRHTPERIPPTPPATPPPMGRPSITEDELREMFLRQQRLQHVNELDYIEPSPGPPPVPPKRTRSRTASLAPEDDRTSHGAESLPGDFIDEYIPRDSSSREASLPGYAVIEKRDKPPRPPPPRRKRQDKFATAPRPIKSGPKRPARPYSTLRSAKSDNLRKSAESIPFMDADYSLDKDEPDFHKDLRSGEILIKMQGRPLPAPPRPPRHKHPRQPTPITRRSPAREITPDFSETVASTQTDPLPDDLVIEEEITTAKLIVSKSRSGSAQVLISQESERVPSPTAGSYKSASSASGTPPIPPLPSTPSMRDADRSRAADMGEDNDKKPSSNGSRQPLDLEMLRSAIFSTDEPLRIPSLEVGDLKVERLTVTQLEAYKVAASEIDAIVVSATEMSGRNETEGIHPSLLQELIAIRNQLQAVAASQPISRPQSAMEDACTATSNERVDLPFDDYTSRKSRQDDHRSTTLDRRSPFTRESSPLLIVQPPPSEQEATADRGRTIFPLSSSITDLASTSDSVTVTEPTIVPTQVAVEESSKLTTSTVKSRLSRSRSPSPMRTQSGAVRQTASPVKSLPPVISVTPDNVSCSNNNNDVAQHATSTTNGVLPQRAIISYQQEQQEQQQQQRDNEDKSSVSRESSRSPPPLPSQPINPITATNQTDKSVKPPQFIAFPTSQIPAEFFALANPSLQSSLPPSSQLSSQSQDNRQTTVDIEPSIAEMTGQLLRALRQAGNRSLRQFVDYIVSRFPGDEPEGAEGGLTHLPGDEKLRNVELAVCALLILIAGLIIVFICTPRTVTHHHHWDYFNPPQ